MRINSTESNRSNIINTRKNAKVSYKGIGGREIIKTLANPDSLMGTIALESCVTGGRGANAYKRGGFPEFRERFTDDVVSAVFWMKGVDIFNKLGDKFGKHVLNLPTTEFDVGKDALRNPFKNVVSNYNLDNNAAKKLAAFKFSKIIASTLLATGFVGFILPKINQTITAKLMHKNDNKENSLGNKTYATDLLLQNTFEEFDKKITNKNAPSFKGISMSTVNTVAHYLENNKICKMLTCDTGILTGRVLTARNPDEGREYLFRDASSSFFYFASTPLVYKLLQTVSGTSNITSIDPVAAKQINEAMLNTLKNADGTFKQMNVSEFAEKTIGVIDDKASKILESLPFKSDVISLKSLKEKIKDENIIKKASQMANLQPQQAEIGKVLTKQQVADVLKNGSLNTPEFMQKIYKGRFGDALTDAHKYIPMKKITSFRDNIDKYAQDVMKAAKKNNGIVDEKLLNQLNKKSFLLSAGFRIIALGVSAFALGVVIPKLQYAMTAKRTGTNAAPGLRNYQES